MRIVELNLKYYGPFTNQLLSFEGGSAGDGNLHIIYGLNEAGKSTALRALHNGLFGFNNKEAERDSHVHDANTLAIGLKVRNKAGKLLDVVRKKGSAAKSFTYADSGQPVGGDWVLPVAGAEEFKLLFAVDHQRLLEGGRYLAEFKGDLGQAMLAAAGDTGEAFKMIASWQERCEALYKKQGREPALNVALREYRDAKALISKERFSPPEHKRRLTELEEIAQRIAESQEQLTRLRLEESSAQRLADAIPHVTRLLEDRSQLQQLGAEPPIAPNYAERYNKAIQKKLHEESEEDRSALEMKRLKTEIDVLNRDSRLAAISQRFERLNGCFADAKNAGRDIPKHETQREEKRKALGAICVSLGIEAGSLPTLTVEEQHRIQKLSNEHARLQPKHIELPGRIQQLMGSLNQKRKELELLSEPLDVAALQAILTEIPAAKRSGDELNGLREQLARERQDLRNRFASLPLWTGTLEELESSPLPFPAQIRNFVKRYGDLAQKTARCEEAYKERIEEREQTQEKLRKADADRRIPTDEDRQDARGLRNQFWSQVHESWQRETYVPELAEKYLLAVTDADKIADRLCIEADTVAQKSSLLERLSQVETKIGSVSAELSALGQSRNELDGEWRSIWPANVQPGAPSEMEEWCDARKEILGRSQNVRLCEQTVISAEAQDRQWREQLARELAVDIGLTLRELAAKAQSQIQKADAVRSQRSGLEGEIRRGAEQLSTDEEELNRVEDQYRQWLTNWAEATAKLPLRQMPEPALAQRLLDEVRRANECAQGIEDLDNKISVMQSRQRAFSSQFRELVQECGQAGLPGEDPVLSFERLRPLVQQAAETEGIAKRLESDIIRHSRLHEQARANGNQAANDLLTLAEEAGISGNRDLIPKVIKACDQRAGLQEQIRQGEAALRGSCGTKPLEAFLEEARQADSGQLLARLSEIKGQIESLDLQTQELRSQEQAMRQAYALRSLSEVVNKAATKRECAAATIAEHANEYIRIRTKITLLQRAIELYRERHQDPLLARISEYFRALTCDRYADVRVQQDESNRYLAGVRRDGARLVRIDEMSDGTRDQLFLALRLAHVATHCETMEPCPVILDDVLMAFDDERASAALQALAQLAKHTQVLVFTHHWHHVQLAEQALDQNGFTLHTLANNIQDEASRRLTKVTRA